VTDRDARYRRKLLVLLSSATFFEGYDNFVLAFVLALAAAPPAEGTPLGAGLRGWPTPLAGG